MFTFGSNWFISLAVLFLLGAATAAPAPDNTANHEPSKANLVPRSCQTAAPKIFALLDENRPKDFIPRKDFFAFSRQSKSPHNDLLATFSFELPPGATGCMLQIQWPALDFAISSGPSETAEVWKVQPWGAHVPGSIKPSFANQPELDQMVGTVNFFPGPQTSPYKTIVASDSCKPTMSFLVKFADWQQGGGFVKFHNKLDQIGWSMIYNC
ncbi:hypothetical protein PAAG_02703 [Paracoccidioides lutzii Pb01]|uniref:Ubiquitin 3 binding protein But2 C-terminal domain-containing protein n=1 Tax=Paracoccidioides lutzii (strain ATCC MYA-826 / Pb01) TaxID=502779 RepID=C1GW08_PARBA|nr:hypothetical protein PAAG_02703 [Paracoccidioides lutzii Pb01]EEH40727.1 hypothetical protein PAAG_02703 [Paracoccidioides lutzii Pb01]